MTRAGRVQKERQIRTIVRCDYGRRRIRGVCSRAHSPPRPPTCACLRCQTPATHTHTHTHTHPPCLCLGVGPRGRAGRAIADASEKFPHGVERALREFAAAAAIGPQPTRRRQAEDRRRQRRRPQAQTEEGRAWRRSRPPEQGQAEAEACCLARRRSVTDEACACRCVFVAAPLVFEYITPQRSTPLARLIVRAAQNRARTHAVVKEP